MFKIYFSKKFFFTLQRYVDNYLHYYEDIYRDSGIWSKEMIMDWYAQESEKRYQEIIDTIEERLSLTHISYPNNKAIIHWRSKVLLVSFRDINNTRNITDLEIK